MAIATATIGVTLIFLVGGILLQLFLSRKSNRLLGLILPALTFLYALLAVLNAAASDTMTVWAVFRVLAATFISANIPTIVLLAIYFACKEKQKRIKQLEKMNIQDLD